MSIEELTHRYMAMFRKSEDEAAPVVADLLEAVDDDVKVLLAHHRHAG